MTDENRQKYHGTARGLFFYSLGSFTSLLGPGFQRLGSAYYVDILKMPLALYGTGMLSTVYGTPSTTRWRAMVR